MHSTPGTNDSPAQQDQGEYKAVVMDKAEGDDDEKNDKKESLTPQQQLYKWAQSGSGNKLKEFVQEERQARTLTMDIKEFLSLPDDGKAEQEASENAPTTSTSKGCFGGDDDEDGKPKTVQKYYSGNTALHFAALHGHEAFCKDLFELGAKFTDVKNNLNSSPLHLAASSGHPGTLAYILEKYVSGNNTSTALKEKNKIGNTPIHCAVYSGSVECLKILFKRCEKEDIDVKEALMDRNQFCFLLFLFFPVFSCFFSFLIFLIFIVLVFCFVC